MAGHLGAGRRTHMGALVQSLSGVMPQGDTLLENETRRLIGWLPGEPGGEGTMVQRLRRAWCCAERKAPLRTSAATGPGSVTSLDVVGGSRCAHALRLPLPQD